MSDKKSTKGNTAKMGRRERSLEYFEQRNKVGLSSQGGQEPSKMGNLDGQRAQSL